MASPKGALITCGYKKAATWGTPILVGANNLLQIKSHGIAPKVQYLPNESLAGSVFQQPGDQGVEGAHGGPLNVEAQYESMETMIALAMGTAGAPVQQGADIAYKHTWKPAADIFGLFESLVIDMQIEVWEYVSAKVKGFTFEGDSKSQVIKFTPQLVCDKLNQNTSSGTNKTSTIASITRASTNLSRLLFAQLSAKWNAQGGAALGGGDAQIIEKFTLSYMRTLKEDDVTTSRGRLIDEPQDNGWGSVKLSLGFSRYDSALRVADMFSKAQNKASLVFSGPLCNGATNYSASFFLNALQIMDGAPVVQGPGLFPFVVNAEAHPVSAAPTGFTAGYTFPLQMEWISSKSADALA